MSQKNVIPGGSRPCFLKFLSLPIPVPLILSQPLRFIFHHAVWGNYWSTPRRCSRNSCSLVRKTNIRERIISCAPKHIKHRGDEYLFTAELTAQTKSYHLSVICPSIHLDLRSVTSSHSPPIALCLALWFVLRLPFLHPTQPLESQKIVIAYLLWISGKLAAAPSLTDADVALSPLPSSLSSPDLLQLFEPGDDTRAPWWAHGCVSSG